MTGFRPLLCTLTLSWLHLSINSSIPSSMTRASLNQDSFTVLVFNLSFYLTIHPFWVWGTCWSVSQLHTQLKAGHYLGGKNLGGSVPCSTVSQWCSKGIPAPPPTTRTLAMLFVHEDPRALCLSAQSHTTWANLFHVKSKSQYQSRCKFPHVGQ